MEASLAPEWEEAQRLQGIGGCGQSETGRAPGAGGGGVGQVHRPAGVGAPTQHGGVLMEGRVPLGGRMERRYRSKVGQESTQGYTADANCIPFLSLQEVNRFAGKLVA